MQDSNQFVKQEKNSGVPSLGFRAYRTPYEIHATLNHETSRYSPDGLETIEECDDCGQRWQHNPVIGYPVTLPALAVVTGGAGKIASLGTPKHQANPLDLAHCRFCGISM